MVYFLHPIKLTQSTGCNVISSTVWQEISGFHSSELNRNTLFFNTLNDDQLLHWHKYTVNHSVMVISPMSYPKRPECNAATNCFVFWLKCTMLLSNKSSDMVVIFSPSIYVYNPQPRLTACSIELVRPFLGGAVEKHSGKYRKSLTEVKLDKECWKKVGTTK